MNPYEPIDTKVLYGGSLREATEYSIRDRVGVSLSRANSTSRIRSDSTDTQGNNPLAPSINTSATDHATINIHGMIPLLIAMLMLIPLNY
jgi:hypothetical protein